MSENSDDNNQGPRRGGSRPYEVGYGKPPKASQFKKGQSGNPSGRPRGAPSFGQSVAKAMRRRVSVRADGRLKKMSGMDAMAQNYTARAISGDLKAARLVLQELAALPPEEQLPFQSEITVRFVRPGEIREHSERTAEPSPIDTRASPDKPGSRYRPR